jgi:hypothetical protein
MHGKTTVKIVGVLLQYQYGEEHMHMLVWSYNCIDVSNWTKCKGKGVSLQAWTVS